MRRVLIKTLELGEREPYGRRMIKRTRLRSRRRMMQGDMPDAAGTGMDQRGLPGLQPAPVVEHAPGGDQHQRAGSQ
jgi:hypothetical protein